MTRARTLMLRPARVSQEAARSESHMWTDVGGVAEEHGEIYVEVVMAEMVPHASAPGVLMARQAKLAARGPSDV